MTSCDQIRVHLLEHFLDVHLGEDDLAVEAEKVPATQGLALRADESVDLTAAYLKGGHDRAPLVQVLATAACKIGNDPHNQELGLCTLEDYLHTRAHETGRSEL